MFGSCFVMQYLKVLFSFAAILLRMREMVALLYPLNVLRQCVVALPRGAVG